MSFLIVILLTYLSSVLINSINQNVPHYEILGHMETLQQNEKIIFCFHLI